MHPLVLVGRNASNCNSISMCPGGAGAVPRRRGGSLIVPKTTRSERVAPSTGAGRGQKGRSCRAGEHQAGDPPDPWPAFAFALCGARKRRTAPKTFSATRRSCRLRRSGDPFRAVPAWWLAHAPPIIGVRPGRSCPLLCCCSLLPHNRNVYVPGHHHCIWHWRYCLLFLGDRKKEKCASNSIC